MRLSHHKHLVYFFTLLSLLAFAGCTPKLKPVSEDAAPVLKNPVKSMAKKPKTKQSGMEYEAGDKTYPDGYYVHTVSVPNESISIIARWYTGNQKNWVVLAKCNPNIKPNRIFLGNRIKIPRTIMTRQTRLPAKFVQQAQAEPQRKEKKKISRTKTTTKQLTPEKEEAPLLFGPKGY